MLHALSMTKHGVRPFSCKATFIMITLTWCMARNAKHMVFGVHAGCLYVLMSERP